MRKITLALAASTAIGCAVAPQQPVPPAASQPATSTTTTPTPSPIEATLAKGTKPPSSESSSLIGWLFPDRLKDISVPIGRTPVGMWMYGSSDEGMAVEFAYNIAWQTKAQKLEKFEITVNHLPAFTASSQEIIYNGVTPAAVTDNVPIGSSTYQGRFDTIVAWATIPKEAQAMSLQVSLDVTKVKKVTTGEILDPDVPAMAADAVIVKWWQ